MSRNRECGSDHNVRLQDHTRRQNRAQGPRLLRQELLGCEKIRGTPSGDGNLPSISNLVTGTCAPARSTLTPRLTPGLTRRVHDGGRVPVGPATVFAERTRIGPIRRSGLGPETPTGVRISKGREGRTGV